MIDLLTADRDALIAEIHSLRNLLDWTIAAQPRSLKEGDRVIARKFESRHSTLHRGGVLWLECMEETIGKVGTVVKTDRDGDIWVDFADGHSWTYPPEALALLSAEDAK